MNKILKKNIFSKMGNPLFRHQISKKFIFWTLNYHPKRCKNTIVVGFGVAGKGWLTVEVRIRENLDFDAPRLR